MSKNKLSTRSKEYPFLVIITDPDIDSIYAATILEFMQGLSGWAQLPSMRN